MTKELYRFIVRYLSVAIIGTAVIFFGARYLKKSDSGRPPNKSGHVPSPRSTAVQNKETGNGLKWGVITKFNTKAYNTSGNFLRILEPGTLAKISETKDFRGEEVAVCEISYKDRWIPDILIRTQDLDIRTGPLSRIGADEKNLHVRRARLTSEITRRKNRLTAEQKKRNPYSKEYSSVRKAYKEYWTKVRDLQKKRDSAAGADHMRYSDELRKMKGRDIELAQELKAAKKKFSDWKNQHTPAEDPEIAQLKTALEDV